jgi:hypothetical protein
LVNYLFWGGYWSLTGLNTRICFPNSTLKLVKRFVFEREKGEIKKGMIMDLVNKAVLSYISMSKEERIGRNTHTQKQQKIDKLVEKEQALTEEYERIHEVMLLDMQNAGWSPRSKLTKSQMDSLVLRATACKARSLSDKYKELLAHGVITYHLGEYRVKDKSDVIVQEDKKANVEKDNIKNKEFDMIMGKYL